MTGFLPSPARSQTGGVTSVTDTAAPPAPTISAADEAASALTKLQADPEWRAKVLAGHNPPAAEFKTLMAAKTAEPATDRIGKIIEGTAEVSPLELVTGGELSTHNQMLAAASLREMGIGDDAIRQVLEGRDVSQAEQTEAKRLRDDRMADQVFVKRYLNGNREAAREMELLNIIIVSGVKSKAAA
jgi:hypothetical protein